MKITTYLVAALGLFAAPCCCISEAHAAMGLKCSDYLNARAHVSFDVRTGKMVDANPVGLPPVPSDVDLQVGQLTFYLSGTLESLTWIDSVIENHRPTKPDVIGALQAVDRLCRKGLEIDHKDYDALDMVTLNNHGEVLKRIDRMLDVRRHQ